MRIIILISQIAKTDFGTGLPVKYYNVDYWREDRKVILCATHEQFSTAQAAYNWADIFYSGILAHDGSAAIMADPSLSPDEAYDLVIEVAPAQYLLELRNFEKTWEAR